MLMLLLANTVGLEFSQIYLKLLAVVFNYSKAKADVPIRIFRKAHMLLYIEQLLPLEQEGLKKSVKIIEQAHEVK
jgi:hypothetical protein